MKYTIFGESHGPAIGVTLTEVPSGLQLDMDAVAKEMARRAPGKNKMSTARKEADAVKILSGLYAGKTCGTPLCAVIENTDTHSSDYQNEMPRPGHADYTGSVRYGGCNDYRGGGHFSGRLTAPLVFTGSVAKQLLAQRGVFVGAHIRSIHGVLDADFELEPTRAQLQSLAEAEFPVLRPEAGAAMAQAIEEARLAGDSVGGEIECCAIGVPAGFGAPDFGCNVEGILSQHLFAVPAVKAVAFGAGFGFGALRGSEANDAFYYDNGVVKTKTNRTGGVNGGITNGMPVVFTVAMRPTPSISVPQDTVNTVTGQDDRLVVRGRHDPCVVHRAVPVIEAACALALCEILGI